VADRPLSGLAVRYRGVKPKEERMEHSQFFTPLIISALLQSYAYAEETREIWECNTGTYYSEKSEHNLWLVKGSKQSYVKFYKTRISASYYLHGLNRRWDWEQGNFSVRLNPENRALYFDFSGVKSGESVNSKSQFACKKIQG
jgi:hypothetical protein